MVKKYKETKDKGNFLNIIDSIPEKLTLTYSMGKDWKPFL